MRVKTKGILTGAMFVLIMALLVLLAVFTDTPTTASAATTPKYAVAFNYSATYTYGTGGGVTNSPSSGTGVYSASFTWGANKSRYTLSVSMYGSSASGTGSFVNGGFIDSTEVTIEVSSSVSTSVTITNSSGTKVGSGTKKATASGLTEDTYTGLLYTSPSKRDS